jgi:quinol monooxygenase YgiN
MKRQTFGIKHFALATAFILTGFTNTTKGQGISSKAEAKITAKKTKQHLIILSIKDEFWAEYLDAMHNNIAKTKEEKGGIIFKLFQPEDGSHKVALMERFKSKPEFEEHFKADYVPKELMGKAKDGEVDWIDLDEVAEIPPVEPQKPYDIISPRNVLVFFDIKPEKRQEFINAAKELIPQSRKAEGNVRFNIFQQEKDQNKFLFVESWASSNAHETQLKQDFIKKFFNVTEGMFLANPLETRWFANDISK